MIETRCKVSITRFSGQFGFLSNFHVCDVSFAGLTYQSAEAAFQAQKTLDPDERVEFMSMTAREAKRRGKRVQLREGWNEMRVGIMLDIVTNKFKQNSNLAQLLLNTGEYVLVEGNDWGDHFWGVSAGHGENVLGNILMIVRANLRRKHA